jgi:hypothetical protein
MPAPSTPSDFLVQQGNAQVYTSWAVASTATSYKVQRSSDQVTYSTVATVTANEYYDTPPLLNIPYYYKVAASNGSGDSSYTDPQSTVNVKPGQMTLGEIRLLAQQEADRVNSQFVTKAEWNNYINQSYYELYDMLITVFEDYYVEQPVFFQTTGNVNQYALPNGVNTFLDSSNATITPRALYKLYGVDLGLTGSTNAWVTIKKFDMIQRNRYVFPQVTSTYLGVFNLRYRVIGDNIMFIPTPSAGQYIRLWYYPKLKTLLADYDSMDGISGWTEYVITDAAIKALTKEESDTTALMAKKQALIDRIQSSATNRDVGQPDTISPTRSQADRWGGYGGTGFDGSFGGF